MYQPSSIFLTREISKNQSGAFFFRHPVSQTILDKLFLTILDKFIRISKISLLDNNIKISQTYLLQLSQTIFYSYLRQIKFETKKLTKLAKQCFLNLFGSKHYRQLGHNTFGLHITQHQGTTETGLRTGIPTLSRNVGSG